MWRMCIVFNGREIPGKIFPESLYSESMGEVYMFNKMCAENGFCTRAFVKPIDPNDLNTLLDDWDEY